MNYDELKSLKPNKSPRYDNISSNVVNETSDIFFTPLKHIFNLSLQQGIFPENLKIAKVSPVYKKDEEFLLANYRPISVLPCFSKLERIMYNRLFKYLSENSILYKKQFGFQTSHSTEHAILLLINQLYQSFDESKFTLGIFIDLSKAFDTVDHKILTKKLELYGIKDCNLRWFESYLSNRKQFITYGDKQTNIESITCGVPQGPILGPLLFLIFVNGLHKVTKYLDPIMFADDTNFFCSHKNIKTLFQIVNSELKLVTEWFLGIKLSLNAKKTKCVLFHKVIMCDSLPLQLPAMTLNNIKIKRKNSVKFLGVIIDENLTWKNHIEVVENKISKNIGVLYGASHLLDFKNLLKIYFFFIHIYISCANISWASTFKTKLQGILKKQKHAARITFHALPLLR